MNETMRLSDVPVVKVERISTGFEYLDKAYGMTVLTGRGSRIVDRIFGLPLGGVSLWAGSPGVGKTRVCIAVAGKMNANGYRVFYIQNEVDPEQFRTWTADKVVYPNDFYIHTTRDLAKQVSAIHKCDPHLVVLDSLNMLPRYQSPDMIRAISEEYKRVARDLHCHIILIGHLNKQGTVKGNNDVEYLIDVQCNMYRADSIASKIDKVNCEQQGIELSGMFILEFIKNRYGATASGGCENYVAFRHVGGGIECVTSNFASELDDIPFSRPKRKKKWRWF